MKTQPTSSTEVFPSARAGPTERFGHKLRILIKRALDVACLIIALPAWCLLMLGVAILVKIVSPGPVFFVHPRVGYRGRVFRCFKFRTMSAGASTLLHREHVRRLIATDAPMTKLDARGDPRLIRFGAYLRASGFDELPQLINVILGDMSLVGPRPCTLAEYEQYLPWQKERFDALPGLTGLWQVSGKNKTTFSQMIALDVAYVRAQTLLLDLRILGRTVQVLFEQIRDIWQNQSRRAALEPVAENGDRAAARHSGRAIAEGVRRNCGKAGDRRVVARIATVSRAWSTHRVGFRGDACGFYLRRKFHGHQRAVPTELPAAH